jgi:hypothetical protein
MLLEKSLVLTGEIVESNSVWQGAPASRVFEYEQIEGVSPAISFEADLPVGYAELV